METILFHLVDCKLQVTPLSFTDLQNASDSESNEPVPLDPMSEPCATHEFLLENMMKTERFTITIKTAAIFAALLHFATASAADLVAVPASAPTQVTRAQVKQELQQAIANGEIRHGDLADFQSLVEPSAQRVAVASTNVRPANAVRDDKAPEAQARATQTGTANDASSGH